MDKFQVLGKQIFIYFPVQSEGEMCSQITNNFGFINFLDIYFIDSTYGQEDIKLPPDERTPSAGAL